MYPDTSLYINGAWSEGLGKSIPVVDPATGQMIGHAAHAKADDLDHALDAAAAGFDIWRQTPARARCAVMRKSADILRERVDSIARVLTLEQGKPITQARGEILSSAEFIEWFADESLRTYGRVIPSRNSNVVQRVIKEPVGPVAAFAPWNFPIFLCVRKVAAALAAGCSIVLKGAEETPASVAEMVRAFADGGLPAGVLNLVYGEPTEISEYLIPHPVIRKISFTGSTAVGKHLAMLAGKHMKRITLELGGHAPAIVFEDADLDLAVKNLALQKFRNAGQICTSPTRILVHESIYERFVDGFVGITRTVTVGNGLAADTQMGPLIHRRRVDAMQDFVDDAVGKGATVKTGGSPIGDHGFFFEPTVMTDVSLDARMMNEEPFGPIAMLMPFADLRGALAEANRLRYGLAAYAFTRSAKTASAVGREIASGMVSINHWGLSLPETPFGGVNDSGYGSEGGTEALEGYLNTKFITQLDA